MPGQSNHRNRFDSRYSEKDDKKREWQRTRNNLLGIVVAIIIIAFAFDLGGIATSLSHYLFK